MHTLRLLLSAFISSWQFFKETPPSALIEFKLLKSSDDNVAWQEFTYRPKDKNLSEHFLSTFFNPKWNETLYIMNCTERVITDPSPELIEMLEKRIIKRLKYNKNDFKYFQFRLVFTTELNSEIRRDLLFTSELKELNEELSHDF